MQDCGVPSRGDPIMSKFEPSAKAACEDISNLEARNMVERALTPRHPWQLLRGGRELPWGWGCSLSSRLTLSPKGADPKTEPQRKGTDPRTGPSQNVNGETSVQLPPCPFWPRLSGSPGACRWCVFCRGPVLCLVVFGFLFRSCAVLAPGFWVILFCVPGFDSEFKVERAPSPEPSIAGRKTHECRRCGRYGIGYS